jgi:hypothetical protein
MSHPNNSSNSSHKNGDICWVAVLRDTVVLVETTGDSCLDGSSSTCTNSSSNSRPAALDMAIRELLGQPVNLGWQFYSPWQKEYKGIKFHIYDDSDSVSHDETHDDGGSDEEVTVWTFACIYYTGVVPSAANTGAEVGSTCATSSTGVVHRPRLQAFLEKIMLLTEPLRQADDMWRKGEQYACQAIYADMIWQRLQEEQLEYQQSHGHVVNVNVNAADHLDYTRKLTENNRQVVNRHNQVLAERDERKRCQELALLQQMQELNQRLEREQQQQSHNNNNNNSKKGWWQSSSSTSQAQSTSGGGTSSSSVAQQLLAAASRQIFSTSSSLQSQASSSSSSINSVETIENNGTEQQQQQVTTAPMSKQGLLLHMNEDHNHRHHRLRNGSYDDDDVHSVESINAMSDVSSVCVEDILSQLEREVTFRNHHAHDVVQEQQQQTQQEPKTPPSTPMRAHVYNSEEEKKEMEHDDDEDWNEPQQSSQSDSNKSLHIHHGEAPKSPSSTMADVVLGE